MGTAAPPRSWPADIVHVNEDGWVLINRGRADGVALGLRVLVVGSGTRELRDLFANGAPAMGGQGEANEDTPVVLRTRRTYELLEIVHVEQRCAVAIASRTPAQRRPEFYAGPACELLVWVPLPADYTWPQPGDSSGGDGGASDESDESDASGASDESAEQPAVDDGGANDVDAPPGNGPQADERWEAALPLNGVNVGDAVILAVPAAAATGAPAIASTGAGSLRAAAAATDGQSAEQETPGTASSAGTWDKTYDWMHPKSE